MSATSIGPALQPGQALQLGQCLTSANRRYRLELQAADGNLVLYHQLPDGGWQQPTWASKTQQPASHADFARELVMQADGNLVLYRAGHHEAANSRWSSATNQPRYQGGRLELQNDGNLVLYAGSEAAWSTGTNSHAHWMEDLKETLTLKNVCVPGSHDVGMYHSMLMPGIGIRGLAKTQTLDLYGQLRAGSRYFDLRPRYVEGKGLFLYHGGADGDLLLHAMNAVKRFFEEGSAETVVLRFSDWDNIVGKGNRVHEVLDLVKSSVGSYLLAGFEHGNINHATLAQLRGKVIVVIQNNDVYANFIESKDPAHPTPYAGFYSIDHQARVFDEYANKQTYGDMLTNQADKFQKFDDDSRLFMLNWTLTPLGDSTWEQFGSAVWRASVETYAGRINPELKPAAERNERGLFGRNDHAHGHQMVNILNLDYLEQADAVGACLAIMHRCNP